MKDRENVLKWLDEVDNMVMILDQVVERGMKIDPAEARNRFRTIRQKLQVITDRVSGS
jgi:phosphomevalonate kinase